MKVIHLGPALGFRLLNERYEPVDPRREFDKEVVFSPLPTPVPGMVRFSQGGKQYYLVDAALLSEKQPIESPDLFLSQGLVFHLFTLLLLTLLCLWLGYFIFFPLSSLTPWLFRYLWLAFLLFPFFWVYRKKRLSFAKRCFSFLSLFVFLFLLFVGGVSLCFISGEVPNFLLDTQWPLLRRLATSFLSPQQVSYLGFLALIFSLYSLWVYRRIHRCLGYFLVNRKATPSSLLCSLALDLGFSNVAAAVTWGELPKVYSLRRNVWFVSSQEGKLILRVLPSSEKATIKTTLRLENEPRFGFSSVLFSSLYHPVSEEDLVLHKHVLFTDPGDSPWSFLLIRAHLQTLTQSLYYDLCQGEKGVDWYYKEIAFTHPVLDEEHWQYWYHRVQKALEGLEGISLYTTPEPRAAYYGFYHQIQAKEKEALFDDAVLLIDIGDGTTDLTLAKSRQFISLSLPIGARRCVALCLRTLGTTSVERAEAQWLQWSEEDNRRSVLGSSRYRLAFRQDGTERRDLPGFRDNLELIAHIVENTNPGLILFAGLGATSHSLKAAILEAISERQLAKAPVVLLAEHLELYEVDGSLCPNPMKAITALGALYEMERKSKDQEKVVTKFVPLPRETAEQVKRVFLLDGDNQWSVLACQGVPQKIRCGDVEEGLSVSKFYDPKVYYHLGEMKKFSFLEDLIPREGVK